MRDTVTVKQQRCQQTEASTSKLEFVKYPNGDATQLAASNASSRDVDAVHNSRL
jgi:hypothetical protein